MGTPEAALIKPLLYDISIELAAEPSADLLNVASVLHRRGVQVLHAHISRPIGGLRMFSATFAARTPQQAVTVARTLQGRIGVLDVRLRVAPTESHHSRRSA